MQEATLNVQDLFLNEYTKVTKQLSQIELEPSEVCAQEPNGFAGVVQVKENCCYDLALICNISYSVAEQIVKVMSGGTIRSKDNMMIYLTEYINIATGRAITHINNYFKRSIRFAVPVIKEYHCDIDELEKYLECFTIYFKSDYGEFQLQVAYTVKDKKGL